MAWQVVMIATEERVDELSGLMWSLGTLGVEVRDQRGHNEDDHLVNRVEVRASFAHRVVADEAMTAVEALGPERSVPTWTVEVPDDAGLDAWRPYAKVERAGAFVIRPSWVPSIHPPEEASVHPGPNDEGSNPGGGSVFTAAATAAVDGADVFRSRSSMELSIDPVRTFGSGSHASTRLALELLSRAKFGADLHSSGQPSAPKGAWPGVAWSDLAGRSVLDVGVGSGILSIAAARLGADNVIGVDVDPDAPRVTAANAAANGVGEQVAVINVPLRSILGRFDVVVANILAPVLIDLAREMKSKLNPGGLVILAGFLAEQEDMVLQAFGGLRVVDRCEDQGWSAVCLAAPAAAGGPATTRTVSHRRSDGPSGDGARRARARTARG